MRKFLMKVFYVPKVALSKTRSPLPARLCRWVGGVWVGSFIFFVGGAMAVDRVSYVSVGTLVPYQIKPTREVADLTYALKFSVFFDERLASIFGVDLGFTNNHRLGFVAGFQWYLGLTHRLDPYMTVAFLYKFNDRNKPGWRSTLGGEWNLRPWTGMDNLRVFAETGASYVYDEPHQLWFEMLHVGAAWHF